MTLVRLTIESCLGVDMEEVEDQNDLNLEATVAHDFDSVSYDFEMKDVLIDK